MTDMKLVATDGSLELVFSNTRKPQRLVKNLKHEWRIRYSYSYKPVKKARNRKRDSVRYTVQGQCDETFALSLITGAAKVIDYYFANPNVTPNSSICSVAGSRCPAGTSPLTGDNYGFDRVVFTACEIELQSSVPDWRLYKYKLTLEEARLP